MSVDRLLFDCWRDELGDTRPMFKSDNAKLAGYRGSFWGAGFPALVAAGLAWLAWGSLASVLIMGLWVGLVASLFVRNRSTTQGELKADATGILYAGKPLIHRSDIKQGFIVPYKKSFAVRIVNAGKSLNIVLPSRDEARQLLRALELDPSQTSSVVSALGPTANWSGDARIGLYAIPGFLSVMLAVVAASSMAPALVCMAVIATLLAAVLTVTIPRTEVRIGTDGISTRYLGKKRFIPYSEIASVSENIDQTAATDEPRSNRGVKLTLTSGELVCLATSHKRTEEAEANLLFDRVREAREAFAEGAPGRDTSALRRNGRAPRAWLNSLRAVGDGANADMRTAPLSAGSLRKLVQDPSASPVDRACASVALASRDPREKQRIRFAAKTTVSPKLRVALERASAPEVSDDELATLLMDLEAEGEPQAKLFHEAEPESQDRATDSAV